MKLLKAIKEAFRESAEKAKPRTDCHFIGEMAGHKWYKPATIDDTITDRYLEYQTLSIQYDTLGIKHSDLMKGLGSIQEALRAGNIALAAEYNTALMAYTELALTNDIVFSICNCFIMIDDEPIYSMSPAHSDIKKKLYDSNNDVKIFFCEVFNILNLKTPNSQQNIEPYSFLKERLSKAAEGAFLNVTREAVSN